jgi:hypothetical protein
MGLQLLSNHEKDFIRFIDPYDHFLVLLSVTMTEQMYSHDTVWLLLHNIPLMEYARQEEPKLWRKFLELVSDETAQGYPDTWNTTFLINKIAEDLGSYKLLLNIWLQIEEPLNDVLNPIQRDWIDAQL